MTQPRKRFGADRSGATAVEYALIAAMIAVVLTTAMAPVQEGLRKTFEGIANAMPQP